jgi:hypothetical protein
MGAPVRAGVELNQDRERQMYLKWFAPGCGEACKGLGL